MASWEPLGLLLNAPSKKAALKCFNRAFVHRNSLDTAPHLGVAEELAISQDQAQELMGVLVALIKQALYESSVAPAMARLELQVPGLDPRIRGLIEQILSAQLPDWREAAVLQRPSYPKYIGVDWRVDVSTASDRIASRLAVPSLLLDLRVQEQAERQRAVPGTRHVEVELSREALGTMLEGLGRIRDQLGGVLNQRPEGPT
mmetsp:Transcript_6332/g.14592  ORF Transcript_6332/g.14592 Transcript_6332/m.14592 type:complete len:202 (-) Transcript_6332:208-813(-)